MHGKASEIAKEIMEGTRYDVEQVVHMGKEYRHLVLIPPEFYAPLLCED